MGPEELEKMLLGDETPREPTAPAAKAKPRGMGFLDTVRACFRQTFGVKGAMEARNAEDARDLADMNSSREPTKRSVVVPEQNPKLGRASIDPQNRNVIIFEERRLPYKSPHIARIMMEAINRQSRSGIPDQVGPSSRHKEKEKFLDSLTDGDVLFCQTDTDPGSYWVPIVFQFGSTLAIHFNFVKNGDIAHLSSGKLTEIRCSRVFPNDDNGKYLGVD